MFNNISSAEHNYLHIKFPLKNYFDKSKPIRWHKAWGVGLGSELRLDPCSDVPWVSVQAPKPLGHAPTTLEGPVENF